jgi:hypothetical protein
LTCAAVGRKLDPAPGPAEEARDASRHQAGRSEIEEYELADANRALVDLKTRRARGAMVLRVA